NSPGNRKYQLHRRSGASIKAQDNGTIGLFLETTDNKYFGLSCGHVLGEDAAHRRVQQPCSRDFLCHIRGLGRGISSAKRFLKSGKDQNTNCALTAKISSLQKTLDELLPLKSDIDQESHKNLSLGGVVKSEFEIVE